MIKIVNGKKYDTEKSERIGHYSNGDNSTNFCWYEEELYITKKGNYFLYGDGNASSYYSESDGNSSWGIRTIIPMTREEAFEWCQETENTDTILEHFSDFIEEA